MQQSINCTPSKRGYIKMLTYIKDYSANKCDVSWAVDELKKFKGVKG